MKNIMVLVLLVALCASGAACTHMSRTQQGVASGAALGGLGGAGIAAIAGGSAAWGALAGAGMGALAGGIIGHEEQGRRSHR
ncbi:MAG: cell envelope biogenesis protein OmpA [Desulfovibrio sp.]|jgi:hypothetical protein|nr:cell envelope biogenesis protein OmpA [Desulfovibrio sp.]